MYNVLSQETWLELKTFAIMVTITIRNSERLWSTNNVDLSDLKENQTALWFVKAQRFVPPFSRQNYYNHWRSPPDDKQHYRS